MTTPTVEPLSGTGTAELSAFQQAILTILANEARHGLGIRDELETYYDAEVNHSRLYTNLDKLIERGLAERSKRDGRSNEYSITETGYDVLFAQLAWQAKLIGADDQRGDTLLTVVEDAIESA